ncbi:MAG: HDOD domain-containing protein, partial [Planctomycetota bacterium]|nr:HDOD domain-containing protein [Planctomycetota bacterium]
LHGIGKLVLDQYAPHEFQRIIALAREKCLSFAAAEKNVIQTGYAELGFWLTQRWKLAEEVQQAILYQNRVAECPEPYRPAAAALAVAVYICRAKQYGASGDYDRPAPPMLAWDTLLLRREDVPEILGRVDIELQRAQEFLDVIQA